MNDEIRDQLTSIIVSSFEEHLSNTTYSHRTSNRVVRCMIDSLIDGTTTADKRAIIEVYLINPDLLVTFCFGYINGRIMAHIEWESGWCFGPDVANMVNHFQQVNLVCQSINQQLDKLDRHA